MPEASSSKRRPVENPFIKLENRSWIITEPASLTRAISPPPSTSKQQISPPDVDKNSAYQDALPASAAVEAGAATVVDQLAFWTTKLQQYDQPRLPRSAKLSFSEWRALYERHASTLDGSHFVVHQHDHPVAGTHYDLRLQCNRTSSISFAIMYGLPGDPNSRRLNRNATETRVHCLWNHLIETASLSTGSMLIWDTGSYEILPYRNTESHQETDSEDEFVEAPEQVSTEQQKLHEAFASRKIRLRLHGTRLQRNYTLSLRLTKENYRSEQPGPPSRKRKRKPAKAKRRRSPQTSTSGSSSDSDQPSDMGPGGGGRMKRSLSSLMRHETPPLRGGKGTSTPKPAEADPGGSDHEAEDQEGIRRTNAYPGATNDIGSVHQRKWYLSMDRRGSGFLPSRDKDGSRLWVRGRDEDGLLRGFERFHVLGRDAERSVVTGRLAKDILKDEDVVGFVPRALWRGVTE